MNNYWLALVPIAGFALLILLVLGITWVMDKFGFFGNNEE